MKDEPWPGRAQILSDARKNVDAGVPRLETALVCDRPALTWAMPLLGITHLDTF